MSDSTRRRIAIIGGGLSGLATAAHLHLADPALQLCVFESSNSVGGVIQTEASEGFVIDHGADMFASNPSAAIDLCHQLGVEDQLIQPKLEGRGAQIVCRGKLTPIPDGFVLMRATKRLPMLTTTLLSPLAKLRLLMERFKPCNVDDRDQSVADFVRTRMGSEILDRLVGPLVGGIYTADVEKLSMHATMGPIAKMVRQHGSLSHATANRKQSGEDSTERNSAGARYNQFRAFKNGMTGLISALAQSLDSNSIRTSTKVDSIQKNDRAEPRRWRVSHSQGKDDFDHVVVACPASAASNLLEQHAPNASKHLGQIECASAAIVVLGVKLSDVSRPANTFGFVVPAVENRKILAGSFASNKFSGRAPEGHLLVRVFIGGVLQAHLLEHDDEQLIQIAKEELGDLVGLSGDPVVQRVIRWNHAMPQYHVGHLDRVKEIEEELAQVSNLSLVSNSLRGVGIAPIIAAAKQTAITIRQEMLGE